MAENLEINESIKKLVEKVTSDETLMNKFKDCASVEEAYKLATSVVDGYTLEEFQQTMVKLNGMISNQTKGELTDDDLQQVAGGKMNTSEITAITSVVTSSASAAASAAT